MELRIPMPLIEWIDKNRGHLSRQAYIIRVLSLMKSMEDLNEINKACK